MGVNVGVSVGEGVALADGVKVIVGVKVSVGVGVNVGAGVNVGVGVGVGTWMLIRILFSAYPSFKPVIYSLKVTHPLARSLISQDKISEIDVTGSLISWRTFHWTGSVPGP